MATNSRPRPIQLNPKQKMLTTGATVAAVILLLLSMNAFTIVKAGHVGVITHFGAIQDEILPEGLHMITPFRTKVVLINGRTQKMESDAKASSNDLQQVTSKVALNFHLLTSKANVIYQKLGVDYQATIVEPSLQESVKKATAQYTAEQLITQRANVKQAIFEDLKVRLDSENIIVTELSIVDFNFSNEFNRAIEEKQVAEQAALRAKNDLDRIKTEAEQAEAKAKGEANARLELAKAEAEAQKLLRETVDDRIIKLRAIEKWDGVLPVSLGGDSEGTFFDVVGAAALKKNKTHKLPEIKSPMKKRR
jgi:prohibitin 2